MNDKSEYYEILENLKIKLAFYKDVNIDKYNSISGTTFLEKLKSLLEEEEKFIDSTYEIKSNNLIISTKENYIFYATESSTTYNNTDSFDDKTKISYDTDTKDVVGQDGTVTFIISIENNNATNNIYEISTSSDLKYDVNIDTSEKEINAYSTAIITITVSAKLSEEYDTTIEYDIPIKISAISPYNLNIEDANLKVKYVKKQYTITNMVANSGFENGLTDWNIIGQTEDGGVVISTSCIKEGAKSARRIPSAQEKNYLSQKLYWEKDHKYYYFFHALVDTDTTESNVKIAGDVELRSGSLIEFFAKDADNNGVKVEDDDGWTRGSVIYTPSSSEERKMNINYGATDSLGLSIFRDSYIDAVGVIDLTEAFGEGKEPDIDWCDNNINYFNGTTTIYK